MIDIENVKQKMIASEREHVLPPMALARNLPVEKKLVILVDIVGFSKGTSQEEVYKIYCFQHYVMKNVISNHFNLGGRIRINQFIPTGDGCYIVADECDNETALSFLVALTGGFQYLLSEDDSVWALRASAVFGECIPFLDLAHHKNYIGEGMNEASRILSYGQSALEEKYLKENPQATVLDSKMYSRNSLYVGNELAVSLKDYIEDASHIFEFKNVPDKHGKTRDITVLQGIK